jgi:hypothetical protein
MDIVLGALVLIILVALHLFMIVVAHRSRVARSQALEAQDLESDHRTRAVWESGG